MAKEYSRTRRVATLLQRELAILIQQEINDPGLGMVTVSGVDLASDMKHAKVYVTVFGNTRPVDEVLEVLKGAAGFLRHEVAQRVLMRVNPALSFIYDASVEKGANLSALIDEAVAKGRKPPDKPE
ncbi:MAG: 30S ribosome-binding factor RbfA [Gammaproteobacteria bacterium]|jgi:ribosome-binding factor A|nr:30S ribosome-binding factor RbfA [Gammaproteobacteria bacterium]